MVMLFVAASLMAAAPASAPVAPAKPVNAFSNPTPLELSEVTSDINAACLASAPPERASAAQALCACVSKSAALDVWKLEPRTRQVFLVITKAAGNPGRAQKAAETELGVKVDEFVVFWNRVDPIGRKAGQACQNARAL